MKGDGLHWLFGHVDRERGCIHVTPRGVEIPIGVKSTSWSVLSLATLLTQIEALPETPGDWSDTPW